MIARVLAYEEWPLTPDNERKRWADKYWQKWTRQADAILAALTHPAPDVEMPPNGGWYVHLDNIIYHLDDVEVDEGGNCKWADVASQLQHIKACRIAIDPTPPSPSPAEPVREALIERLQHIVNRLEDVRPVPSPYSFYYAAKNEDAAWGWSYFCVGLGISDIKEIIAALTHPAPPAQRNEPDASAIELIQVPRVALEWLFGAMPDHEGLWFGESVKETTKKYGWRSRFREICAALGFPLSAGEQKEDLSRSHLPWSSSLQTQRPRRHD
ncbi:MAG TPA: hypothetical protein VFX37_08075 [Pseudolabrys sp.]|nr:hypothetical protein [Pseudolabrys sp.]